MVPKGDDIRNREGEREKERVRDRQTKKDREERDWALGDGRKEQTHSHKRGDEVRFSSQKGRNSFI